MNISHQLGLANLAQKIESTFNGRKRREVYGRNPGRDL